jgi:hypothetical protein
MLLISARFQKLLRLFFKLGETVMAAKIVSLTVVFVPARGFARLYLHAADWINHYFTSACVATSQ